MSKKEEVDIKIDSREPDKVIEVAVLHEDVNDFLIEEMEEGDLLVEECLFERKTAEDFASSLQDGRLREQIERMAARKDVRPFVLVEGDMEDFNSLPHTELPAKSLRGMTASMIGRNNIHVVFCSSPENTIDMAVRIARKDIEDTSSFQVHETDSTKDGSFLEKVFMAIEGIGIKTAENLASTFVTLENTMEASIDDFKEAEGVGDSRAKEIYNQLHEETEQKEDSVKAETKVFNI